MVVQNFALLPWTTVLDNVVFSVWVWLGLSLSSPGCCPWTSPSAPLTSRRAAFFRRSCSASGMRKQITVVFITHSMDEAVLLGDRVVR
ncbi:MULTISPECIES: hypothetical protein [unclassified Streptomyces]|uniref:hypothetical protein n=1 Tax=unclassified Streptomyces TaxID=2593676 RepID=UPI00070CAE89|nr:MULTISPECIES: hypothetical protein [unclassified Streptomyces]KRD04689.1 hypothetical protein ASE41_05115 [Streptomyces sp. Root264]